MATTHAWWLEAADQPSETHRALAVKHQQSLTKPPGSLGDLETVAETIAAIQATETPRAERVGITVFAGDHGVAEEGVSAFPQVVTAEMIKNFARGGAAISVLARELGAKLEVINTGTVTPHEAMSESDLPGGC